MLRVIYIFKTNGAATPLLNLAGCYMPLGSIAIGISTIVYRIVLLLLIVLYLIITETEKNNENIGFLVMVYFRSTTQLYFFFFGDLMIYIFLKRICSVQICKCIPLARGCPHFLVMGVIGWFLSHKTRFFVEGIDKSKM